MLNLYGDLVLTLVRLLEFRCLHCDKVFKAISSPGFVANFQKHKNHVEEAVIFLHVVFVQIFLPGFNLTVSFVSCSFLPQ